MSRFHQRSQEHRPIDDPIKFLTKWNFVAELDGRVSPTRASVLMFGTGRYVRHVVVRPVLDYQRIDAPFEQWSADLRWHDRYVFEENLFRTWQGLMTRYSRIAERPFALDAKTLRRKDDPPDYVAFREAAINLLMHQDYGDQGRKASLKLYTDRTVFWNPGDAFATDAELLDPTEKPVRNPLIVNAFRRIGLSDQAGTGMRAIFRNWHQLGRMPPRIKNNKARKDFELELVNESLVSSTMARFLGTLDADLASEQANALAMALLLPQDQFLTLTAIRGANSETTRQAKTIADDLVTQGLLEPLSQTHFRVPVSVRQRFTDATEAKPAGTESRPRSGSRHWPESRTEPQPESLEMRVLRILADTDASKSQLSTLLGQRGISGRLNAVVRQLLEKGIISRTIPDKQRSPLQRYRLTDPGRARQHLADGTETNPGGTEPEPGPEPEAGPELKPESDPKPRFKPESLEMRVLGILADTDASKSQLSTLLGHQEISGRLNAVVRQLLRKRLIARTIPDKPRSPLQRYRLTDPGRARRHLADGTETNPAGTEPEQS